MRKYEKAPKPLACYVCGNLYGNPAWIEAIVPDDIWELINPSYHEGGGILCIQCIANRLWELRLENVPVMLTAGPLVVTCNPNYCVFEKPCP